MLSPGELTLGGKLNIGLGGKSRNMAQMIAAFLGKNKVAMIGRTSKNPLGLWEFPLQSLIDSGVDTTYVKILSFDDSGHKYPGIALIPIDKNGKNEIYVLPGVNEDFSCKDIDGADILGVECLSEMLDWERKIIQAERSLRIFLLYSS